MQLHIKCDHGAMPAILSANITLEVILRNDFVETSMKFAFLTRDDTWCARQEGNSKRVMDEVRLIAQRFRSKVSKNAPSKISLCSYINSYFLQNAAA